MSAVSGRIPFVLFGQAIEPLRTQSAHRMSCDGSGIFLYHSDARLFSRPWRLCGSNCQVQAH
ncbi:hypothetical protein D779_1551 [Imhoffiella purpurea]|uniref:Uncharacterized protein n=1 Tax=Imhoffiella purpurea TaxID=1249627 RepID=W9V6R3_9GAMM|nr:hypothetical protein D779_1551 [Imhoffiella purpurea]